MNILVTGGTGFIGSHLIHKLLTYNHQVILLKRSISNLDRIKNILSSVKTYDIDIKGNLEKVFSENHINFVIHLATLYIKHHQSVDDINKMSKVNIEFPTTLLELARQNGVSAFINTGTCFEYEFKKGKLSETDKISAYDYYAATKLAFEEILKYYAKSYFRAVTLKLFYPYGEKDNEKKLIPLIIKSLILGNKLPLTPGLQRLNYTYVEDVVSAYIKMVEFINSPKYTNYEIFNIGQNKTYSVRQLVKILENISGEKSQVIFGAIPFKKNEIMYINCNFSKAKKFLNWTPTTDIVTGLRKTYNYYQRSL